MNKRLLYWIVTSVIGLLAIGSSLLIYNADPLPISKVGGGLTSCTTQPPTPAKPTQKAPKGKTDEKAPKGKTNEKGSTGGSGKIKDTSSSYSFIFYFFVFAILVVVAGLLIFLHYARRSKKRYMARHLNIHSKHSENDRSEGPPSEIGADQSIQLEGQENSITECHPTKTVSLPIMQSGDFVNISQDWRVIGASVIGSGHISSNLPCQDNNGYAYLGDGWGIAVVSDGAGSASNSQIGSKIVVERALFHFSNLIKEQKWIKHRMLPSNEDWNEHSFLTLKAVRDDVEEYALIKSISFKSLSATAIIVIHTPIGLLTCHVGDGRAGYQDLSGNWHALLIPHKGEEANQTVFLSSEFWNIPYYRLSKVRVPEARVVREPVKVFVLMSDGCEHACWECNKYDEIKKVFFDPNSPSPGFFNPLLFTIYSQSFDNSNRDQILEAWRELLNTNEGLVHETDDKTLIVGAFNLH